MISFDLKSGYHHVAVHPMHWQYLGFAWEQHAKVNYCVFKVLPHLFVIGEAYHFPQVFSSNRLFLVLWRC